MNPPVPADPDDASVLRVNRSLAIPVDELAWRFTASGGPGGQHANTSNTRAEVRFDIAGSPSLTPDQRRRLTARLGPEVRVVASDTRSQAQNRTLALRRLGERLAEALRPVRARRPTKPSLGAKRRRLEAKQRRSQRKSERSRRFDPGD